MKNSIALSLLYSVIFYIRFESIDLYDRAKFKTRIIALKLKSIINRVWYFKKYKQFSGYEKALKKAISDREVDQIILKDQIIKYMRKYLGADARSKYIPKDFKNREECRQQVLGRFGDEMEKLGITINEKLELCTL